MSDCSTDLSDSTGPAPMTVLLVDDQRFIGMVVKSLLLPTPEIVLHHCTEAAAAVATANEVRPDVILQDLVMEIDGLTLVTEYRRNPQTATTPIVVLSGHDDVESRAGAAGAGANDYLIKVPTSDALVACLRRHAGSNVNVGSDMNRNQAAEQRQ